MTEKTTDRYAEGVRDALEELASVYGEGIKETDLWSEYMSEGEGDNCLTCSSDKDDNGLVVCSTCNEEAKA